MLIRILLIFILLVVSASSVSSAPTDTSSRRDYVIYYDDKNWPGGEDHDSINTATREKAADRYNLSICNSGSVEALDQIIGINSNHDMIFYITFQDNLTTGEEHQWQMDWILNNYSEADTLLDPLYLHFYAKPDS